MKTQGKPVQLHDGDERFVGMKELCSRLSCTRQDVYEKARFGLFTFGLRKMGKRTGCLNSELEAYLTSLPQMEPGGIEQLDAGRRRAVARRRESKKTEERAAVGEGMPLTE